MRFYRTYILPVFVLSLMLISATQVFADDNAEFFKVIGQPSEQLLIMNAARKTKVEIENPCSSAQYTNVNKFAIYEPLKLDKSGKVIGGVWKQSVSAHGCGEDRLLNVLVIADDPDKDWTIVPLFPGTTRADPFLQKDAITYAVIAATKVEEKECDAVYVANTEFLHEAGEALEGAKGKPWDELWTLSVCKQKAQVTMHFIPDKTGTTIRTSLSETKFFDQ